MSLRGWSWDAVAGPAGLGDRPLLEALEAALPDAAVEAAIERTGTRERRRRVLPTHLVVTLVVAMGLWADGVGAPRPGRGGRRLARGAGRGARRRWGRRRRGPARAPVAPAEHGGHRAGAPAGRGAAVPGAVPRRGRPHRHARDGRAPSWAGCACMAVDGTTLDVADTPENARAFGRPTTHRGAGAFPQLRVVALIETGTHALCDVVLRPFRGGEAPAARHLLRVGRPGHAAAVGPGLPRLRAGPAHARPGGPLPGPHQDQRRAPARPRSCRTARTCPPSTPRPTARRRREGGIVVRVVEYALDTPAGPGTRALPAAHLAAGPGGLPRPDPGRDLPRAVGGRDRPGRGQGPPVGPPPPPAQQAPARGRPGGLRPAAGPPGHPHPDVPGRPAATGSTPTG